MSRQIYESVLAVDQLPVFEPDGIDKHPGLAPGDFTVQVWQNGAERTPAFAVAISEIGGGEYKVEWTPDDTGFWLIEVTQTYNDEKWSQEYDVVKPVLLGIT